MHSTLNDQIVVDVSVWLRFVGWLYSERCDRCVFISLVTDCIYMGAIMGAMRAACIADRASSDVIAVYMRLLTLC